MSALQSFPPILIGLRLSYEAGEVFRSSLSHSATTSEKINKIAISVLDSISSFVHSFTLSESNLNLKAIVNLAEGFFRFVDLVQSIELLKQNNPNINRDYINQTIALNIFNIYRLGLTFIHRMAPVSSEDQLIISLAIFSIDVAIRMYSVISQRADIKDWIVQHYQNFNFAQAGQSLDYVGRVMGHSLCVLKSVLISLISLAISVDHDESSFKLCAFAIPLSISLTVLAQINVSKIFDKIGVSQHSAKRFFAEWTIAIASSTMLAAATSVGVGLASSIGEIYRRALPNLLISGLYMTIGTTIAIGLEKVLEDLGFQPGLVAKSLAIFLSLIYTTFLGSSALVGFGLVQSREQAIKIFLRSLAMSCTLVMSSLSIKKVLSLIANGPMSWNDIMKELTH